MYTYILINNLRLKFWNSCTFLFLRFFLLVAVLQSEFHKFNYLTYVVFLISLCNSLRNLDFEMWEYIFWDTSGMFLFIL